MNHNKLYISIVIIVYALVACVFLTFPRSRYSELEKRDLAEKPDMTVDKIADSSYPKELSSWFSDSEPYRDELMSASMWVRDKMRINVGGDEAVSFHASTEQEEEAPAPDASPEEIAAYKNRITAGENAKIANKGIIVIGQTPKARALMAYGGTNGGDKFAEALNRYHSELGVNVYAVVIPLASEFYTPDKAKKATKPQLPTIRNIYSKLQSGVKGVNAYSALASHVNEDIYLRTDHHWAPLGAYYAAEQLAKSAGVPFKPLANYDRHVVKRFVGSMYGYSKDIAIKNSPEDFVYYTPRGLEYNTTYVNYKVGKDYRISSESKPQNGPFFYHFKDGSGGAYCTFMGSDMKLTKVKTGTKNGRHLMIIKDSYGNAVPGYMFYSFEEVHVVDFRYFNKNMNKYVRDNKITDIAFVVNIFNAYAPSTAAKVLKFLGQNEGITAEISKQPSQQEETARVPASKETSKRHSSESESSSSPVEENSEES